ncbi:MAG: ribbon-helix-helix domain-containing protein [Candidatus Thorarchaeota archaeon]
MHLPEKILADIQRLVDNGLYPNRSEAIRIAIRDLLKHELWGRGQAVNPKVSEVIG